MAGFLQFPVLIVFTNFGLIDSSLGISTKLGYRED